MNRDKFWSLILPTLLAATLLVAAAQRPSRPIGFANDIKAFVDQDVNPVLFDAKGNPRFDLYRDHLLHLYPPAYVEFIKIIRPVVEKAWEQVK